MMMRLSPTNNSAEPIMVVSRDRTFSLEGCHTDKEMISYIIRERNITRFVHFTRIENLHSILKYGLISIEEMKKNNIKYVNTDNSRLDGHTEAISISVSFPNYKMLYSKMIENNSAWVILEIDPIEIIQFDCLFCKKNAASGEMRRQERSQKNWMSTPDAFESMFDNDNNARSWRCLPDYYTTDPQAEILVRQSIPRNAIKQVIFQNETILRSNYDMIRLYGMNGTVNTRFFGIR
ncbi:MAG: DUF4433 domain-containing protein [Lachnospiraceae bacterium]|nr:DUF4433 domain-containing protein [Lachnospiraceae bacterium]